MCNAFFWKRISNSTSGAKISWESVCTSKMSDGLGLRRLLSWNKVLGLKLIWLLFIISGPLWVSWVMRHLIGHNYFWDLNSNISGSWIWRNKCRHRPLAHPLLCVRYDYRLLVIYRVIIGHPLVLY